MRGFALLGPAVLAALLLGSTPSLGQESGGIVLYQEDDYGGGTRALTDDEPDLDWIHFDDRISSVRVLSGTWELCEHSGYHGRCIKVDGNIDRLDRYGFDDIVSSVRLVVSAPPPRFAPSRPEGEGSIVLYQEQNFEGGAFHLNQGDANLSGRVSSVEVIRGIWELCDQPGYRGRCVTVDGIVPDITTLGLSGNIASAHPVTRD